MIRAAQLVYDCIPNAGSDPGIGWHSVVAASGAGIEVHAVTKESNRSAIEAAPPLPGVTWHFLDVPEKLGPISTGTSAGDAVHLLRWLRKAKALCTTLAERGEIDLTHFVTFSAFWAPVPFAEVPVPHVFGPVGGGERTVSALENSPRDRISASARGMIQSALTRVPAWGALMTRPDTVVVSGGRATTKRLEAKGVKVFETAATGCLPDALISQLDLIEPLREEGTTLVASGRQLRWKGHDLAIKAMPTVLATYPEARLVLLGSGPVHNTLRELAVDQGVADNVIFRTDIGREEERRRIAGASCFVFPSRRDTGSTLVPLVQVLRVPIAAFETGALPDSTGGFAQLAQPGSSPHVALGYAMIAALQASPDLLEDARNHAMDRHGEATARESLTRWYNHALSALG